MMTRICPLLGLLIATPLAVAGTNVVVVLDDSGSMNDTMRKVPQQTRIQVAKEALLTVLDQVPPDSKVGVVLLNGSRGRDKWIIPLGPMNKTSMESAIRSIRADGGTPLGDRMKSGANALLNLWNREHYGFYRLLIATDGEATDASLVEEYLPEILSSGITVDVIGVDMASRHSLATKVHTYRSADNPEALSEGLAAAILGEVPSDPGGAGAADFALLEGISTELARACLGALQESGRSLIGEARRSSPERDGGPPSTPVAEGSGGSTMWIIMAGVVLFLVLIFVKVARKRTS